MNKTKIIIIGAGFGGVYTAKNLAKLFGNTAEITIINKNSNFIFTPLLHEVATGSLTPQSVVESLDEIFRGTSVNFIEDKVLEIDRNNKIIKTVKNNSYTYDYLIISVGAETNYFSVAGAKENSFALKDLNDAVLLKKHIVLTVEKAIKTNDRSLLTFSIIGAGATGVELAGELIEYLKDILTLYYKSSSLTIKDLKVQLITNTQDIISQFPIKMREIAAKFLIDKGIEIISNSTVTKMDANTITIKVNSSNEERTIETNTKIWVAGVKPSIYAISGIEIGLKGRMDINEFLQSKFSTSIFGLGDSSGEYPMLAQIAVQQSKIVAYNIYSLSKRREMKKFDTKIKGLLISLGKWSAIGNFKNITLHGPVMWWIWRTVYLFNYNSWKKRFKIMIEWTLNLFYPRDITLLN